MAKFTDEIDGDSPIADAACGVAKEGHAIRWLVVPHSQSRHDLSSHDQEVADVDVGISEGKHGGEVARVGARAVDT